MPNNETHHYYHKLGFLPILVASTVALGTVAVWIATEKGFWTATYALELWFWINAWYLAGRYIDPDWDILGVSGAEGRLLREGGFLGVFAFGYTSFYAALIAYAARKFKIKGMYGAHRSWLTHSPIGTLIRIFFINAPLFYGYQMAQTAFAFFGVNLRIANSDMAIFLLAQLLGLGIADGIHVLLDARYTEKDG